MDLFADYGAQFSECKKHRYALWRIWNSSLPLVMFIGLNPSTANENQDDPTIRRVKKFAHTWGFGGFYMMNLFSYISAYPEDLKKCPDPVKNNDEWLLKIAQKCSKKIFAWGSFDVLGRDIVIKNMFPDGEALIINKDGSPRHPLYVKKTVLPVKMGFYPKFPSNF